MNDARSNTDEATIKAQIVRHWAQRAGLDVAAARAAYLEHEKAKELARV
jgi:hypothetical protein